MERYPESFLLLTERSGFIIRRQDIISGNVILNEFRFPTSPPFDSLESNKPFLCAWTRPLESHDHHHENDGGNDMPSASLSTENDVGEIFYVATVDGYIQSLEATLTPSLIVTYLGKTIGSAGALSPLLGDYLVAVGTMGDGSLLKVNPLSGLFEQKPENGALCNWAPMVDCVGIDIYDEGFDSLYTCSVNKPLANGTIREIRQGINVAISSASNSCEYESVNGMWFCTKMNDDGLIMMSIMDSTVALRFNEGDLEDVINSFDN
jgi:hypothetical protein